MALKLRVLAALLFACFVVRGDSVDDWLAAQSKLKTWTADFTQTRTLKTLKQPLQSKGHLSFAAPNNFRWQLGDPAQTIAVRNTNEMTVIYPRLKTAERYPLGGAGNEPWRDALALMDAGFPSSREELQARFKLVSIQTTNATMHIVLEPKSAMAKRFMSEVQIFLRTEDFAMTANQLQFADGSILRNDFTNAVVNPTLPADIFTPDVPKDFAVTEPLKK